MRIFPENGNLRKNYPKLNIRNSAIFTYPTIFVTSEVPAIPPFKFNIGESNFNNDNGSTISSVA